MATTNITPQDSLASPMLSPTSNAPPAKDLSANYNSDHVVSTQPQTEGARPDHKPT